MTTSTRDAEPRAVALRFNRSELVVDLEDGRRVAVPIAWFPRLLGATAAQRRRWRFIGGGLGIHWPALDEDLSVAGFLAGTPALPRRSAKARPARARKNTSPPAAGRRR